MAAFVVAGMAKDDREFKISKNLDIFMSVYKELQMFYVDEPNPDDIVPAAIDKMLSNLDPYTTYIPEKDKEAYRFQVSGEYGGVGSIISVTDTDLIQVKEVYAGTPSWKVGLKPGDMFLSIDGESMRGKKVQDVSNKLRGKAGETVKLELQRIGVAKPVKIDIVREIIKLDAVDYYGMLDSETGYISLRGFETDCAEQLKKAFLDLRDNKGAKRLLLDLRNNPGGLLDESLQIVNLFVPEGSKLLSTHGRRKAMDRTYTAFRQPVDTVMPIVVMINRSSASASEIVAGALQDLDRAVIVGQRSFGKGLVQTTRDVAYDGYLKVTTAKYYTPSGRCVQALDYTNKGEDGAVGYVADSLLTEYKTKHGRSVYDGGGISPDVLLESQKYKPVTISMIAGDFPFKYLISLQEQGKAFGRDKDKKMTDAAYEDFIAFMKSQKKFTYKTRTQEACQKMISTAKSEGLYEEAKAMIDAVEKQVTANLERDMRAAKDEIKPIVESEAIRITELRRASIGHTLQYDTQIDEAKKILADGERYRGLLSGTVASHAGDKRGFKVEQEKKE